MVPYWLPVLFQTRTWSITPATHSGDSVTLFGSIWKRSFCILIATGFQAPFFLPWSLRRDRGLSTVWRPVFCGSRLFSQRHATAVFIWLSRHYFSSFSEFCSLHLSALISGLCHLLTPIHKRSTFCCDGGVLFYLLLLFLPSRLQYQKPELLLFPSASWFKVSSEKHKSCLWLVSDNFHLKETRWFCAYISKHTG